VTGADNWQDPAVETFAGRAIYTKSRIVVFSSWRLFLRATHLVDGAAARPKTGRRAVASRRRETMIAMGDNF
jgi:hypothetical protein